LGKRGNPHRLQEYELPVAALLLMNSICVFYVVFDFCAISQRALF